MTCARCGADRMVLPFTPGSDDPFGILCLVCGLWTPGSEPEPEAVPRAAVAGCGCEPDPDGTFARTCDYCRTDWAAGRCIHDLVQEPCPQCSVSPVRQLA